MAASLETDVVTNSNDYRPIVTTDDHFHPPLSTTSAASVCMESVTSSSTACDPGRLDRCLEHLEQSKLQQSNEINQLERQSSTVRCVQCNGDVGLEVAVEAHPDLIFESDLMSLNLSSHSQDRQMNNSFGPIHPPRVYLERESFSNHSQEDVRTPSTSISVSAEETALTPMDVLDGSDSAVWKNQKKHFFVLSEAGKPIYTRHGNEEQLVTLFGVMQAIVSVVEDDQDSLQIIKAGSSKFVFLHKSPLILVGVSKLRDSLQQLQSQLSYLYNQILSVITEKQLDRIFQQRKNYDLRRLLAGSERLMDSILNFTDQDYSFLLGAVKCLPMSLNDRETVSQTIVQQCSKIKNLLFAVLIGNSQLVSLVRTKKQVLQPGDIHLIITLVNSSETFKTAEGWIPICLPQFDPNSFVQAYASHLSDDCQACLLFFTSDHESFSALSDAKKKIVEANSLAQRFDRQRTCVVFGSKIQRLRRHNTLECITTALNQKPVAPHHLGISADIRHFLFKWRLSNQFTSSCDSCPPYQMQGDLGPAYLMDLYRYVHGRMNLPSRQLKMLCHTTDKEVLFGWVSHLDISTVDQKKKKKKKK
nr:EOG090X03TW [Sida crystallina]